MAHRAGFIIPNASSDTIVSYRQAEPDAGDFSILGNDRYGVFYGCTLISTGLSVALDTGPHIIMSDGVIKVLPGSPGSVSLNTGSTTDRFDLVGWDTVANALAVLTGTPVDDPTFPDIPDGFVPFAAIIVVAGANSITSTNIIDKRRLLLHGARGAAGADETFLRNQIPGGGIGFQATGSGALSWEDSSVSLSYDSNEEVLEVTGKRFRAANGLSVTGTVSVTGDAAVSGIFTASNFKRGAGDPTGLGIVGEYGDEFSNTLTGQKYIWRGVSIGWAEIYADEYPPGSVIASLLSGPDASAHMVGWLPLTGLTYNEADMGRIPDLDAPFSSWDNGDGTWTVPNLTGRTLIGGTPGVPLGNSSVTLTEANLPAHKHFNGAGTTGSAGSHTHTGSASLDGSHTHSVSGGTHAHPVTDPGHYHTGNHGNNTQTNFIVAEWNGTNKLDGLFNDASHTWSVGPSLVTSVQQANVSIPSSGAHAHSVSAVASHSHTLSLAQAAGHSHPFPVESPVGEGKAVNITPLSLGVTYYVKI